MKVIGSNGKERNYDYVQLTCYTRVARAWQTYIKDNDLKPVSKLSRVLEDYLTSKGVIISEEYIKADKGDEIITSELVDLEQSIEENLGYGIEVKNG